MSKVLNVKDVTKTYRLGEVPVQALRGISFELHEGEFLAILGPSGSGKSTLLNMVGALDRPTSGNVIIDGVDISELDDNELADLRKNVGFVFQFFNLIPRLDAQGNVELPLMISGVPRDERRDLAKRALEKVGLADRRHHKPSELSGGERQRVTMARALVNNPSFLLMDEPTGNLDSKTAVGVMELVADLNSKENVTIIMVTHDPEASQFARRTVRMRDGLIISDEVN
ncbi:ABC transporter ATP-binding protein [Candidatus Thorarchaeota archaeon]|nr:MAG: ABC transporter ATP-binding protein [Candidatus Thorarchaeota archaeon]